MVDVIFDNLPVYSMLGDGRVLQTGWHRDVIDGAKYVGGKIFYIDDTADGAEYTFYTSTGKIIREGIRVGDAPFAYTVSGTPTKDKFYVFNANAVNSKTWTYQDDSGNWVHESLGTQDGIGKGKTNTAIVLAKSEGAYGSHAGTIWNSLNLLNSVEDKGCNDWFVPSKEELERLRLATDRDGNKLTTLFSNTSICSSLEYDQGNAVVWLYRDGVWGNYGYKNYTYAVPAARSF